MLRCNTMLGPMTCNNTQQTWLVSKTCAAQDVTKVPHLTQSGLLWFGDACKAPFTDAGATVSTARRCLLCPMTWPCQPGSIERACCNGHWLCSISMTARQASTLHKGSNTESHRDIYCAMLCSTELMIGTALWQSRGWRACLGAFAGLLLAGFCCEDSTEPASCNSMAAITILRLV